jgi:hypothetical protein
VRIGRRPLFFAALCVVCLVILPFTPAEYRWVNLSMAGLALFWAIAIGLEDILAGRRGSNSDDV